MARAQGLTMGRGNRGLLIVAGLAGLAAAVLFVVAVNQDNGTTNTSNIGSLPPVVVAAEDIPYGQAITEDMLKISHEDQLAVGALGDITQAVGLRAKIDIGKELQITSAMVGEGTETGEGITWVVPAGRRAVGVGANETTAVGGNLLPTDRVDVVATFKIKGLPELDDNQYILRTETILQNVEVLAVGQEKSEPGVANDVDGDGVPESLGDIPDNVEAQPSATTVTLTLTPEQAQELLSAKAWAQSIELTARPVGETDDVPLEPKQVVITE